MKLIVSIIDVEDSRALANKLSDKGYQATLINAADLFLQGGKAIVLTGVDEKDVATVLKLIKKTCCTRPQYNNPLPPIMEPGEIFLSSPSQATTGGATVFILDVAQIHHY